MFATNIIAGLLALVTFGSGTAVAEDSYFVNDNSVIMTETQYEQLEAMGFNEEEIA